MSQARKHPLSHRSSDDKKRWTLGLPNELNRDVLSANTKPLIPVDPGVYNKDLAEKLVDVAYSRIMLLGAAGVGKTSLKRALMKLPFDPNTNSTIISDIDTVQPVGSKWQTVRPVEHKWHTMTRQSKQWQLVTEDDDIDELAHLIAAVCNDTESSMNLLSTVAALSLYPIESPLRSTDLSESEIEDIEKSKVDVILSKAVERASRILPNQIIVNPRPLLHVWDCGGQPVFLEILPAFLTSRSMFLLLFDASKSFEEKWQPVRTERGLRVPDGPGYNMTTQDLLFNWMANVHHHLAKRDEAGSLRDYPRMFCIGTHGDLVDDKKKKEIRAKLKDCYNSKAFAHLINDTLIVDNTTSGKGKEEDVGFKVVRNEIHSFAFKKLVVKTPLSWVLFRNVIQMLDTKIISLKEAHAIGVACKIPHNDVPKVLLFYHDLGAILYYPNIRGLQNKVIINPKWFVEILGKIFTLEGREKFLTEAMWKLLCDKGILVQDVYIAAWKNCTFIKPNELMELLAHFCLAAEVKTKEYFDRDATQFFLPAVLNLFVGDCHKTANRFLLRATFLHITFSTNFVPPGFFTRFVTSMAKSHLCELYFDDGVFRNRVAFKFGEPCIDHVTLTDLGYAIQVEVVRYARTNKPFNKVCQQVLKTLEKCGQDIDEVLNTSSSFTRDCSIKIARDFQFVCASDKCKDQELHYLVHVKGQTCDDSLTCSKRRNHQRPTTEESYWFPEEEATKKGKRITQQEMLEISKGTAGDKAYDLAAALGMIERFKAICSDHSLRANSVLQLLYEWDMKGGERDGLVNALHVIELHPLADKVAYDDKSQELREQRSHSEPAKNIPKSALHPSLSSDAPDLPLMNMSSMELQEVISDSASKSAPSVRQSLSRKESVQSYRSFQSTTTLPITIENDILRCAQNIPNPSENVAVIAGNFEISHSELKAIQEDYPIDSKHQIYIILKRWMERHQGASEEVLKERLRILGYQSAADSIPSRTKCTLL